MHLRERAGVDHGRADLTLNIVLWMLILVRHDFEKLKLAVPAGSGADVAALLVSGSQLLDDDV